MKHKDCEYFLNVIIICTERNFRAAIPLQAPPTLNKCESKMSLILLTYSIIISKLAQENDTRMIL